jgi:hypothetical protein
MYFGRWHNKNIFKILKKILIFNNLLEYVQYFQVSNPSKYEIFNIARCLETAFYILTFVVLISYMYFNLNTFNDMVNRLTVVKS